MQPHSAGKIDVTVIAALAAAIAALAAVLSAALVVWQVRDEGRRARLSIAVESVWHLREQWDSSTMLDIRSSAAAGLLAGKPTADVDEVLGFFEEVVLLVDRGAVDEELAALQFYWPMASYWSASQEYVEKVRHDRPAAWEDVGGLVARLSAIQARRRSRALTDMLPLREQVQQFLLDEQGSSECTDDSEAEKRPASFGFNETRQNRQGAKNAKMEQAENGRGAPIFSRS